MALFKFLNPFLEAASFHQASRILFKGALRILLVILKDFPEFLVEHYIGLCAAIPAHCIQLRNVVLCAFPRGVTLRLDVNSLSEVPPLPEFNQVPDIRTDYVRFLEDAQIRQAVDRYIADETPNPAALVPELRNRIAISVAESDGSPGVNKLTILLLLSTRSTSLYQFDCQPTPIPQRPYPLLHALHSPPILHCSEERRRARTYHPGLAREGVGSAPSPLGSDHGIRRAVAQRKARILGVPLGPRRTRIVGHLSKVLWFGSSLIEGKDVSRQRLLALPKSMRSS